MTPTQQTTDPSVVIRERNEADEARKQGKPLAPQPKTTEEPKETEAHPRLPHSVKRQMNRLMREAAEYKGRLAAYEELGVSTVPRGTEEGPIKPTQDPEPTRSTYATQHEFDEAKAEWRARQLARQEAEKVELQAQEREAERLWAQVVSENTAKMNQDKAKFEDWDEIQEAAMSPDFNVSDQLTRLLEASEYRADVLYYLCTHREELNAIKSLEGPILTRNFGRLETKAERLYSKLEPKKSGPGSPSGRNDPADSANTDGRNAAERDARKPRPSAEVAARGGSAAPTEITVATNPKAWIDHRNQIRGGR